MKLAEALIIRKDTQTRIEQLKNRILNNVKVQEGDEPSEDPKELLAELSRDLEQLEQLIFRINKTNTQTVAADGRTMTQMLAQRDVLGKRLSILRDVFNSVSQSQDRYSNSEIKMVRTLDVKKLAKQVDKHAAELRTLDTAIQALNFTAELAD